MNMRYAVTAFELNIKKIKNNLNQVRSGHMKLTHRNFTAKS